MWSLKGKAFWGAGGEDGRGIRANADSEHAWTKADAYVLQIQVSNLGTQEALHNLMEGLCPWEEKLCELPTMFLVNTFISSKDVSIPSCQSVGLFFSEYAKLTCGIRVNFTTHTLTWPAQTGPFLLIFSPKKIPMLLSDCDAAASTKGASLWNSDRELSN